MNQRSDTDWLLCHWMSDGPSTMPDRVIDVVADRISRQPQRRTWRLNWRLTVSPAFKYGIAAAAILVVAVVGYSLLPKGPSVGTPTTAPTISPTPSKGPTVGTPTTAPTISPTPSNAEMVLSDGPLTAGRYRLQPFTDAPDLTFTAEIPAGWLGLLPVAMAGPLGPEGPRGISVSFLRADGMFSDPCHWDLDGSGSSSQPGDLAVGPSANLSGALAENPSYAGDGIVAWSGFPADVGIGEVAGHQVTIRVPASVDIDACDKDSDGEGRYYVFSGPDAGLYAQGNGNIWEIHILGLDRLRLTVPVRLIIVLSYFEDTPASDLAAGKAIVGSFDFVP